MPDMAGLESGRIPREDDETSGPSILCFSIHGINGCHPQIISRFPDGAGGVQVERLEFSPSDVAGTDADRKTLTGLATGLGDTILFHAKQVGESVPIVLLAYDLGGSILKEALNLAATGHVNELIAQRITMIIFFGTPHRPQHESWHSILFSILSQCREETKDLTQQSLMKSLELLSQWHEEISLEFGKVQSKYKIVNCFQAETVQKTTPIIVEKHSATLGYGDEEELARPVPHYDLAKFELSQIRRFVVELITGEAVVRRREYIDQMHLLSSQGVKPETRLPTSNSIEEAVGKAMRLPNIVDWLLGRAALSPGDMASPGSKKPDGHQPAANVEGRDKIFVVQKVPEGVTPDTASNEQTKDTKDQAVENRNEAIMPNRVRGTIVVKLPTEYSKQPIADHIVSSIAMPTSDFGCIILRYTVNTEDARRSNVIQLLCSLSLQLLAKRPRLFDQVRGLNSLVRQAISASTSWTVSVLFLYLKKMMCGLPQSCVVCVLQLLEPLDDEEAVLEIIARLNTLTAMTEMGMRLLVIIPNSANVLLDPPTFSLMTETGGLDFMTDNSSLCSSLVQSRPALAAVKDSIVSSLERFIDFQLSQSYLQHLAACRGISRKLVSMDGHTFVSPNVILNRFMPKDLKYGYEWAKKAIIWLSICFRPLSLDELATALALECNENGLTFDDKHTLLDIEQDLRQELPGIVCIENGMVKLAHQGFRDLIIQDEEILPSWCRGKSLHSHVAGCCLGYLKLWGSTLHHLTPAENAPNSAPETETMISKAWEGPAVPSFNHEKRDSSSWPLLQYAAEYWFWHHAKAIKMSSLGIEFPADLLDDSKTMNTWVEQYRTSTGAMGQIPACDEGLTPLQLAKQYQIDIPTAVELFLRARIILGCQSANNVAELLCVATEFGYEEATTALRRFRQTSEVPLASNALYKGFQAGMSSAFNLLTENDPAFAVEHGSELLLMDIRRGESQVLDYLNNICLTNMTFVEDSTPLHEACQLGHVNLVERIVAVDKLSPWLEVANKPGGYSPLHLAALHGHSDIVSKLLSRHANSNTVNSSGEVPLHTATRLGLLSVVSKILQDNNVNPAFPNREGQTPLHIASTRGYSEICSLLVQSGVSIYAKDQRGDNSIHLALRNGHGHLIETFLSQPTDDGAKSPLATPIGDARENHDAGDLPDLNSLDAEGNPALALAIENHLEAAAQLLIRHGANLSIRDSSEHTPLMLAVKYDYISLVETLLANHADPNLTDTNGDTALHITATLGHTNIAKVLLAREDISVACKNHRRCTPLHIASDNGHLELVQEVLRHADNGASEENDWDYTPVKYALLKGHTDVFVELLRHGAKKSDLDSMIILAAQLNNEKAVEQLLDAGANKNFQDEYGNTALQCAAYTDSSGAVQNLLARYVNLELKDMSGHTALSDAARRGSIKSLIMLLDAEAKIETEDSNGRTPLHQAAFAGQAEAVKILVLRGAEMRPSSSWTEYDNFLEQIITRCSSEIVRAALSGKSSTRDAYTVPGFSNSLWLAVRSENPETVNVLLDHGADPNETRNKEFGTPLSLSAYDCNTEVAKKLLEHPTNPAKIDVCAGKYGTALNASMASGYKPSHKQLEMVDYLLKRGANPNIEGEGSFGTVLHTAIRRANATAAMQVFEKTKTYKLADFADNQGRFPIHIAAWRGHERLFNKLLDVAKNKPLCDEQKRLPIHFAAAGGQLRILEKLVDADTASSINTPDKDGWTPLHWSCRQGSANIVKFLLDKGAKRDIVSTTSGWRWTPMHVAVYHNKNKFVDLLDSSIPDSADKLPTEPAEYLSDGLICDGCLCIIYGDRHKCEQCYDFDYCFKCFWSAKNTHHTSHSFLVFSKPYNSF